MDEVQLPGAEGYFGVLPGHTPLLASLAVGEMWYRKGDEKIYVVDRRGFAEVLPDRVTMLAQVAERADEHRRAARRSGEAARRAAPDQDRRPTSTTSAPAIALLKSISRLQVCPASLAGAGSRVRRTTSSTAVMTSRVCAFSGPSRTDPGTAAYAATRTATARVRISACSSWPTAWAGTSPARSPRAIVVEAIEAFIERDGRAPT